MPFYEVVFETGRMSVMECADDAEAQEGMKNHNDRAASGESGGPIGQPAERIAAVYKYDVHPAEFNPDATMTAEVAETEIKALIDENKDENGVVSLEALAVAVRGLSHPMEDEVEGFGSRYRMKEKGTLDMGFLTGTGSSGGSK